MNITDRIYLFEHLTLIDFQLLLGHVLPFLMRDHILWPSVPATYLSVQYFQIGPVVTPPKNIMQYKALVQYFELVT